MPRITALEAEAAANLFLSDHLPDRLCAANPRLYAHEGIWCVPVILAYPMIGRIGEVGEVVVSAQVEEIISHTPFDEMMARARTLYEEHKEIIEGIKI